MNEIHLLKLDVPAVESAANYCLQTWPPSPDFPVSVMKQGMVVSRFSSPIWDFSHYAGRPVTINFGDGNTRQYGVAALDPDNARRFREIAAFWMYGTRPLSKVQSISINATRIRPIFALCSDKGICVDELWRFPKVQEELPGRIAPGSATAVVNLLHELLAASGFLGFTILDREGIRRLAAALPKHEIEQTPYMPPRIWRYQVSRLREFLDDYLAHQSGVESCYRYCVDAYVENFGSVADACSASRSKTRVPFSMTSARCAGAKYFGSFASVAEKFGIAQLLTRWCLQTGKRLDDGVTVQVFTNYLQQCVYVASGYLLNFSGMRIDETNYLRASCCEVERDERLGNVYLICGATKKTIRDDEAVWITSAQAETAVKVLTSVSKLRIKVAKEEGRLQIGDEEVSNPPLRLRAYEPWSGSSSRSRPLDIRTDMEPYSAWREVSPNLFDPAELRITQEDLQIARLITPTLDPDVFFVGAEWVLAWHQLRRTLAVNMSASGLVSDASLQYQLKHVRRAMSLYYAQGFSRRPLNQSMREECVRATYEVLATQATQLFSSRYVSPYGEEHKANLLRANGPAEHKNLLAKAKRGLIPYRETILGCCLFAGDCPFGGIDSIIGCAGGGDRSPCANALFDRRKREHVITLERDLDARVNNSTAGSPLYQSLLTQRESARYVLTII